MVVINDPPRKLLGYKENVMSLQQAIADFTGSERPHDMAEAASLNDYQQKANKLLHLITAGCKTLGLDPPMVYDCGVCFNLINQKMENKNYYSCGHIICQSCLARWVKTGKTRMKIYIYSHILCIEIY